MFLYRENELELLQNDFCKPNSTLSFIFGRRKVGKTTLVNEYIKDKNVLYLSCFDAINTILFDTFKKTTDDFFKTNTKQAFNSFEDFVIHLSQQKIDDKIVIVLENINDYLKNDKEFLISFNKYWNKYLKHKNIQFIITSSLYSSQKEDILVFNKADNIIKLKSLKLDSLKEHFPELNKNELMTIFASFGTNPEYLKMYDTKKDFMQNVNDNFLSYNSFIFNEGMSLIKNDLNDAVTYCSILYSIASGNKKIGDIANFLNLKSSYLTRYLQKLVDLMILEKNVPVNENPTKSKFGRYEIEDNFLKFWFSYVYPNSNIICSKKANSLFEHINKDFENRLIHSAYKRYVLELLESKSDDYLEFVPVKMGSWWNNKDVEIDFVAYNSKYITFINCAWKGLESSEDMYAKLKVNANKFETTLEQKYIIATEDIFF